MLKGRFWLLVAVVLIAISMPSEAQASTNVTTCTSAMVSTPLCDELVNQACVVAKEEKPQATVEISASKESSSQKIEIKPEVLSTKTDMASTDTPPLNLDSNRIFDLVNQFRSSQGLPAFEPESSVCELAQTRSGELAGELAQGAIHSGLYNRNLPYWIWENAKVGSNEEETVNWWLGSFIHRQSILGDYKYSCVKCQGTNCSQLFTSFVSKSPDIAK